MLGPHETASGRKHTLYPLPDAVFSLDLPGGAPSTKFSNKGDPARAEKYTDHHNHDVIAYGHRTHMIPLLDNDDVFDNSELSDKVALIALDMGGGTNKRSRNDRDHDYHQDRDRDRDRQDQDHSPYHYDRPQRQSDRSPLRSYRREAGRSFSMVVASDGTASNTQIPDRPVDHVGPYYTLRAADTNFDPNGPREYVVFDSSSGRGILVTNTNLCQASETDSICDGQCRRYHPPLQLGDLATNLPSRRPARITSYKDIVSKLHPDLVKLISWTPQQEEIMEATIKKRSECLMQGQRDAEAAAKRAQTRSKMLTSSSSSSSSSAPSSEGPLQPALPDYEDLPQPRLQLKYDEQKEPASQIPSSSAIPSTGEALLTLLQTELHDAKERLANAHEELGASQERNLNFKEQHGAAIKFNKVLSAAMKECKRRIDILYETVGDIQMEATTTQFELEKVSDKVESHASQLEDLAPSSPQVTPASTDYTPCSPSGDQHIDAAPLIVIDAAPLIEATPPTPPPGAAPPATPELEICAAAPGGAQPDSKSLVAHGLNIGPDVKQQEVTSARSDVSKEGSLAAKSPAGSASPIVNKEGEPAVKPPAGSASPIVSKEEKSGIKEPPASEPTTAI
jgi:hypothetical protein